MEEKKAQDQWLENLNEIIRKKQAENEAFKKFLESMNPKAGDGETPVEPVDKNNKTE
jgi:phytoene/squalene synthetase